MRKIKILIMGVFCAATWSTYAQHEAMFTQYMNNELVVNPAYAGSQEALSVTALYRNQWAGFAGAPKTMSLNAHTLLRNDHIGLGGYIVSDEIGANSTTHMFGTAAYRTKVADDIDIHFGISVGVSNYKGSYGDLFVQNSADPNFSENYSSINPNFGAGVYMYSDKFYIGAGSPRLLWTTSKVGFYEAFSQRAHGFLTSGYVFDLADFVKFKPTVFFKFVPGSPSELDLTANFIYKDKYWGGLAYRSGESVDLLVMYQFNQQFKLGYSYDIGINSLSPYNGGSHEFVLNYRFHYVKSNHISPRYF